MSVDYLRLVTDVAKAQRDQILASAPSVVVQHLIGQTQYPRCQLCVTYRTGEAMALTVTAIDDGREMASFGPGRWQEATQVEADGQETRFVAAVPVSLPCLACIGRAWFVVEHEDGTRSYQCNQGHLQVTAAVPLVEASCSID